MDDRFIADSPSTPTPERELIPRNFLMFSPPSTSFSYSLSTSSSARPLPIPLYCPPSPPIRRLPSPLLHQNEDQHSPPRYSATSTYTIYRSPVNIRHEDVENKNMYFENNRIKPLQDELIRIQKKSFTEWCNAHLNKVSLLFMKFIVISDIVDWFSNQ